MATSVRETWQKELRILLDRVEHHPSADLSEERQRIVVLQQLIRGGTGDPPQHPS
ncbi:hypothetical protein [Sphingomonas sp. BK235]|jgi:hypothetical protein|uniref:hypothetical protein n=1 Tax=Sphingomonas sp. BK235 TaxID=2512131 RepID=UPI0010D87694|nr:hypothetical protein [Sphingomonas sp. BK235]TCP34756.1 hypothetical protein EV292_103183 [Sphingomonas sp. BK235]